MKILMRQKTNTIWISFLLKNKFFLITPTGIIKYCTFGQTWGMSTGYTWNSNSIQNFIKRNNIK